jgi:hypothetical protein
MSTIMEVLNNLHPGDVFEAGRLIKGDSEPLVWMVDDVVELDGEAEVHLSLYYYDIFVKEESVLIKEEADDSKS